MDDSLEKIQKEYAVLDDLSFKLKDIEYINNQHNRWNLRLQFLESHLVFVAASGQGQLMIDGRFIELRQGNVYVCVPGQLVEVTVHTLDERGFYYMRFDVMDGEKDAIHSLGKSSRFPVKGEVPAKSPVAILSLCQQIRQCWQKQDYLARFKGQILFQELLFNLMQDALTVQDHGTESALEHVKSYMEQHYQQELTIDQLAKVAGISTRHFMRLFKKKYGCSAIDYLAVYRIEQAQRLMRSGGSNRLKDIARYVGYQDDLYFRRKFKQISGVPPAEFMKNSRRKIVAYNFPNIGQLIALQIIPYAAPADHPWTDYFKRKYEVDSLRPLSSDPLTKREEIGLAEPDFIIGIDSMVALEEQIKLCTIAPSYFVPWEKHDWRTHLRLLAQFLDKTVAAETWLKKYERKVLFVREQVKSTIKDDRLLIVRITADLFYALGKRSVGAVFFDDLQMLPAQDVTRLDEQITLHDIVNLDADRLLFIIDEDSQSQSNWRTLLEAKEWRSLKAVQTCKVDFLPSYPWIEYAAFTHDLLLDEIVKLWRDRT
ncbi:helix-turn-helix domain-containing protein [Paenibacillus paeoniae]|uniref:Helix-turn-helix domain-containing protein n=1 Tax=Paenibacillus paeoniae TaxID=2292705 RepID=A0A371PJM8_9BACL|nr:helix-turn-helix domain-containing protein [Paenibacillus paeoniae]REK76408.1 helix-turn-helix domain-containing protein [Paenibacillus paeoniae]